jgi:hypothetical protein
MKDCGSQSPNEGCLARDPGRPGIASFSWPRVKVSKYPLIVRTIEDFRVIHDAFRM